MVRIQRSNGANVEDETKAMKNEYNSWTEGQFTFLEKNAKRGHIDETLSNRMETIKHLPHPFHCQCHIRGCTFGTEEPKELKEHFKTAHNYSNNQIINEDSNAIVQIYGDDLAWMREEEDEETKMPINIITEDNKLEQTITCGWPYCTDTFNTEADKNNHWWKIHCKGHIWNDQLKRMVLAMNPLWKLHICRAVSMMSNPMITIEHVRVNSIFPQQQFSVCKMIKRGQSCNAQIAPADMTKHFNTYHGAEPMENRNAITKKHTPGILMKKESGINSSNFCSLAYGQKGEEKDLKRFDELYMIWDTASIPDSNETELI
jgi:hypothetical protein